MPQLDANLSAQIAGKKCQHDNLNAIQQQSHESVSTERTQGDEARPASLDEADGSPRKKDRLET